MKPINREQSIFDRSKGLTRHPLDMPFACGFDPHGKSIKVYRLHISKCTNNECRQRWVRWCELTEYFRDRD
jgi:hypothetical protein